MKRKWERSNKKMEDAMTIALNTGLIWPDRDQVKTALQALMMVASFGIIVLILVHGMI